MTLLPIRRCKRSGRASSRSGSACIICAAPQHRCSPPLPAYDWLFIDCEHGAFSVQEATQLCLAALPAGITPVVRVCADAIDEGTRALDNGALGIVMPHVNYGRAGAARSSRRSAIRPPGTAAGAGRPRVYGYRAARDGRGAGRRSTTRS